MIMAIKKTKEIVDNYIETYCRKTGLTTHPVADVTDAVVHGLVSNMESLGKPLCPCRFYPDKQEELKRREWLCPCWDMKNYKYCHCMLFVNDDGMPITEHLPEGHEGRQAYGEICDPTPESGRRKAGASGCGSSAQAASKS
jgi:ferredoxin-thioredoxin reductase catalytic chain